MFIFKIMHYLSIYIKNLLNNQIMIMDIIINNNKMLKFHNKKNKEEEKVVKKLLKKGQNWSLDLVLGIIIFLLVLGVFYLLLSKSSSTDIKGMKDKGNSVLNFLDSDKSDSSFAFIQGNSVNITKLETLYNSPDEYEKLKQDLGLTGDFCIVLEDSNGRIVVLGDYYGFGSQGLNVSGCLCGQICP